MISLAYIEELQTMHLLPFTRTDELSAQIHFPNYGDQTKSEFVQLHSRGFALPLALIAEAQVMHKKEFPFLKGTDCLLTQTHEFIVAFQTNNELIQTQTGFVVLFDLAYIDALHVTHFGAPSTAIEKALAEHPHFVDSQTKVGKHSHAVRFNFAVALIGLSQLKHLKVLPLVVAVIIMALFSSH